MILEFVLEVVFEAVCENIVSVAVAVAACEDRPDGVNCERMSLSGVVERENIVCECILELVLELDREFPTLPRIGIIEMEPLFEVLSEMESETKSA